MMFQFIRKKIEEKKNFPVNKLMQENFVQILLKKSNESIEKMIQEAEKTGLEQKTIYLYCVKDTYNGSSAYVSEGKKNIEWDIFESNYKHQLSVHLNRITLDFLVKGHYCHNNFSYTKLPEVLKDFGEKMLHLNQVAWQFHLNPKKIQEAHQEKQKIELMLTKMGFNSLLLNLEKMRNQLENQDVIVAHDYQRMVNSEIPTLLQLYQNGENQENVLQGFEIIEQQLKKWLTPKKIEHNSEIFLQLLEKRYLH